MSYLMIEFCAWNNFKINTVKVDDDNDFFHTDNSQTWTVLYCSLLCCAALLWCCVMLWYCMVWYCVVLWCCIVLWYRVVLWYCVVLCCGAVLCCFIVWDCAVVLCCAVMLCCAVVLCDTVLCCGAVLRCGSVLCCGIVCCCVCTQELFLRCTYTFRARIKMKEIKPLLLTNVITLLDSTGYKLCLKVIRTDHTTATQPVSYLYQVTRAPDCCAICSRGRLHSIEAFWLKIVSFTFLKKSSFNV